MPTPRASADMQAALEDHPDFSPGHKAGHVIGRARGAKSGKQSEDKLVVAAGQRRDREAFQIVVSVETVALRLVLVDRVER